MNEQLAPIDRTLTDAARRRPARVLPPWTLVGMAAGAALFAAGAGFMKLFG